MTRHTIGLALVAAWCGVVAPALAQHEGHAAGAVPVPGVSAQLITQCVDSQRQSLGLVDAANARLETARQSNNPADIRAALADLQRGLLDMRTVLARCTELQQALTAAPAPAAAASAATAADAQAGHVMPSAPSTAGDAHAGHVTPASPSTAADAHAGHVMPSAPATRAATPPQTAHAGHASAPARTSAGNAPAAAPAAVKADAHAGHAAAPAEAAVPAAQAAIDPVCGLRVDPTAAPSATYQGQTYYFCSLQHQRSFLKEPPKYIPKARK